MLESQVKTLLRQRVIIGILLCAYTYVVKCLSIIDNLRVTLRNTNNRSVHLDTDMFRPVHP